MNRLKTRRSLILLIMLLGFLIISNPSEKRFLQRMVSDYGSIHQGMDWTSLKLEQVGSGSYHSYLLFSFYNYRFGNIRVNYFGISFMTFYQGSSTSETNETKLIQI